MVKADLFALFGEKDPWKRGKQLESVLNRLFALDGLTSGGPPPERRRERGRGGADRRRDRPRRPALPGRNEVAGREGRPGADRLPPLARLPAPFREWRLHLGVWFHGPAIAHTKLALTRMLSVLCELEEIVLLLERDADVRRYFREKVQAAITERHRCTVRRLLTTDATANPSLRKPGTGCPGARC